MPEISVIIPCYNIAGYIQRAVQSVLDQVGVSVEVIVVNDNSSDNSLEVLSAISDPRLRVLSSDKNEGPGAARNKGIAASVGEWVAIVDGDDIVRPDRFARMLKLAKEGGAQMVVDNQTVHREADGKEFPMFPVAKFARMGRLTLPVVMRGKISFLKGHPVSYAKPLISAAFLKKHNISYHEEIWIGEDYLFLAEILAAGAVCLIDPEQGYRYTIRKGSISYRMTSKDVDIMLDYEDKFVAQYPLTGDSVAAHRFRIHQMREMRAYIAMVEGIKARRIADVAKNAIRYPGAVLMFWEPVWVRLRRLFA